MIRRFVLIVLTLLLVLVATLMTALFIFRQPTPVHFQQAVSSQPVSLPRDEAAHFDVQSEWWYYTGFLSGEDGLDYGFELVFFKAYVPPQVRIGNLLPISWVANPLYFAHFAVSDLSTQEHVFFERANIPKFWDAGTRKWHPYVREVWNGDWRATNGILEAGQGHYKLRLEMEEAKPPVLHGTEGIVDMGQAGTSYYYSYTDLEGRGILYVDGKPQPVQATAWMDHQWGSWDNHNGFAGWDWFSLRLDDDSDVMLFNFRDDDGSVQPESSGTWIAADGSTQHLTASDYAVEVLDRWTSPDTGATYPVEWHVTVPDHGLDVTVQATFPQQEMAIKLGPIYWEGSVTVEGTLSGAGFVEMTGY